MLFFKTFHGQTNSTANLINKINNEINKTRDEFLQDSTERFAAEGTSYLLSCP